MHRLAIMCALALSACGCDNGLWRSSMPRPSPLPASALIGFRDLALGVELKDEIAGEAKYLVTAPASGTITVQLDWMDRYLSDGLDQSLSLRLDDSPPLAGCGAGHPLRASVAVDEGQQVRIVVTRTGCWEAGANGPIAPFTIGASFQPHSR